MQITIFSIILICVILFFISKKVYRNAFSMFKLLLLLNLILSIGFISGYFIKIGSLSIAYDTFISYLLLLLSIYIILFKRRYSKKILLLGMLFWVNIIFGLIFFFIFPYTGGVIQNIIDWDSYVNGSINLTFNPIISPSIINFTIAAFRFVIIISVLVKVMKTNDWIMYLKVLVIVSYFFIGLGLIEFMEKKILGSNNIIIFLHSFLGSDTKQIYLGIDRLQGLSAEASQFAMTLFILSEVHIYNIIFLNKIKKSTFSSNISILMIYILLVLSTSLNGILLILISIISYTFNCVRKKTRLAFIIFSILIISTCGIILVFNSNISNRLNRLYELFSSIIHGNRYISYETSEAARILSIVQMLKVFVSRPFFGGGLTIIDGHSTFFAVLANFGLIGLIFMYTIIIQVGKNKRGTKVTSHLILLLLTTFFSGGLGYFSVLYYPALIAIYSVVKENHIYKVDLLDKSN